MHLEKPLHSQRNNMFTCKTFEETLRFFWTPWKPYLQNIPPRNFTSTCISTEIQYSFFSPTSYYFHILSYYYQSWEWSQKHRYVIFFPPISYFFLSCPTYVPHERKKKSNRFEKKTWGWINDDKRFIFWWIISLNKSL